VNKASLEHLKRELELLIMHFESALDDVQSKGPSLAQVLVRLRALYTSLSNADSDHEETISRNNILSVLRKSPLKVINGDEIFEISGVQEYARRARELKTKFGWLILESMTLRDMLQEKEFELDGVAVRDIRPNQFFRKRKIAPTLPVQDED